MPAFAIIDYLSSLSRWCLGVSSLPILVIVLLLHGRRLDE